MFRCIHPTTRQLTTIKNGSRRWPEPGCLLIWAEGGEFETTGHVAIVTEVTSEHVRIVEQNVGDCVWPAGQNYAREITAETTPDGHFWLECSFGDAQVLGWVILTDDDTYAERIEPADPKLFNLIAREVGPPVGPDAACIRIDESPVITMESENLALRIIKDKELLAERWAP